MADITRLYPTRRHLRSGPTTWIRHASRGRVRREGVGLAFGFTPRTAVLSEVPVDDRELALVCHARTSDHAEISVPVGLTHRIADPARAAGRLDFGIDPHTGRPRATPLDTLATLLGELAQEPVLALMAGTPLTAALAAGPEPVRAAVAARLTNDPRLDELGIAVVAVRVLAVRAAPELERALQTPTREAAQARADEATFRRRADAVEQERAIAENELSNSIELARRRQELIEREGEGTRRRAELEAEAAQVNANAEAERARLTTATDADRARVLAAAEAERTRTQAGAEAERARLLAEAEAGRARVLAAAEAVRVQDVGAAEAAVEHARAAVLRDLPPAVLAALAVRELAGHLPEIGQLTLTPDVVTGALARLGAA
jgi:SPFH domain / Band 7 family